MAAHSVWPPPDRPPGTSRRRARRALWSVVLAVAGLAVVVAPASAAVDITPTQGPQGGTVTVTFHVPNLRPNAHTTKVEVDLPPDQPVDEVYPLTHPDWIPQIIWAPAPAVLGKVEAGLPAEVTSAIVWTRADDAPSAPPVETLELELGPLPYSSSFVFSVTQTSSDGTVEVWKGPMPTSGAQPAGAGTVLTLVPPGETEPETEIVDGDGSPARTASAAGPTGLPAAGPSAPFPLLRVALVAATGAVLIAIALLVDALAGRRRSRAACGTVGPAG